MKFLIFLFVAVLPTAHGLKCYMCSSSKSFEDCKDNQKEKVCELEEGHCGKIYFYDPRSSRETYSKGCGRGENCKREMLPLCKVSNSTCDIECCTTDLCNTGTDAITTRTTTKGRGSRAPAVSSCLFLTCSIVAFFR